MAPPKKDSDSSAVDGLKALAALMASDSNFNPDYEVVAAEIGIAQGKNVYVICNILMLLVTINYASRSTEKHETLTSCSPRKIDSILKPAGYQIKAKKVIRIGDELPPATPSKNSTKSKEPKTPGASDAEGDTLGDDKPAKSTGKKSQKKKKTASTPKESPAQSPTKKAASTPARTPKSKKRKIEDVVEDEDKSSEEDDEAMKMIKEKMGDSTDEDGDDDGKQ